MHRASISPGDLLAAGLLSLPLVVLAAPWLVPGGLVPVENPDVLVLSMRITILAMLCLGMFALGTFLTTGRAQSLALATGLLGSAALFVWRRVFDYTEDAFDIQIFMPAAQLFFGASLLFLPGRYLIYGARGRGVRAAAAVLFAGLLVIAGFALRDVLSRWAAGPAQPQRVAYLLATACAGVVLILLVQHRRAGGEVPLALLVGVALTAEQSVLLLASSAWLISWWTAHVIWGAAIGVLAWAVLVSIGNAERQARLVAEQFRTALRARTEARAILDAADEAMVLVSPDGSIATVNQPFAALLGVTPKQLTGMPLARLNEQLAELFNESPVVPDTTTDSVDATIHQVVPVAREYERHSSLVRAADGQLFGRLFALRDVTREREVNRLKSEFVSMVTHELRTPLTSIRGSLGLIAAGLLGEIPDRAQHMLEIAVQNTDRLIRLINDVLDLERMESGRVSMERRPTQIRDVMLQAGEAMRGMAETAGVRLEIEPYAVIARVDPDRIMQVLTNLLSNAIKFSPAGTRVRLSAACDGLEVRLYVEDQGRGIPADKLETIFERFEQVDASDAREKGGSGLGLAITRAIVLQHGGRISVSSTLGHGAMFTVALPLDSVQSVAA